jgi:hypothetical protein
VLSFKAHAGSAIRDAFDQASSRNGKASQKYFFSPDRNLDSSEDVFPPAKRLWTLEATL